MFFVFVVHQMSNSSISLGASGVEFVISVFLAHQVSNSSVVVGASGVEFILFVFVATSTVEFVNCCGCVRCRIRQLLWVRQVSNSCFVYF
jgi:hypothetical protein